MIGENFCGRVQSPHQARVQFRFSPHTVDLLPENFLVADVCSHRSPPSNLSEGRKRRRARVAASWPFCLSDIQAPLATLNVTSRFTAALVDSDTFPNPRRLSPSVYHAGVVSSALLIMAVACLLRTSHPHVWGHTLSAPAIWFSPPNWPYLFFSRAYDQAAWGASSRPSSCVACSSGRASYTV